MTSEHATIEPDTKDWTWVLDRPCPECGFDASRVDRSALGAEVRANADFWAATLADLRAGSRPESGVWSPAEYGCHVRDVNRIFAGRVEQLLTEDDPQFANWDQDETARAERYDEQAPAAVVPELVAAAELAAGWYDRVADDQWERPGRRSNGSVFTVETLGRYHLHDLVHHRWDVRWIMGG
ncbi:DinB family protein [Pimelobacter simplex]|uniref:DinB family protein n=1 Tax=Nocardioides simplex TaxID=2045 RepID=UPI0038041816